MPYGTVAVLPFFFGGGGGNAPGGMLLEQEEGSNQAAHLSERQELFGPPAVIAPVWLRKGAWHGGGNASRW